MNKLFTKIVGVCLGLTMAVGVGVAVGSNVKEATPVHAATNAWTQVTSLSDIANNDEILIANANYYLPARNFASKNSGGSQFTITDGSLANPVWKVTVSSGSYKFSVEVSGTTYYLYVTNDNNGVVSGSGSTPAGKTWSITKHSTANTFMLTSSDGTNTRYLTYASGNFRCYKTSGTTGDKYCTLYKRAASKTLSSVAITTAATKTLFYAGDTFDPSGMVLTATYSDSSTDAVTPTSYKYGASGIDPTSAGTAITTSTVLNVSDHNGKTIYVLYTENAVTKYASYTITVESARTITKVETGGDMETKEYYQGDDWDFTGLYLTVTWNKGTPNPTTVNLSDLTKDTDFECDPDDASDLDTIEIYILGEYEGFEFEFTIEDIEVSERPTADLLRCASTSLNYSSTSYGNVSGRNSSNASDITSNATWAGTIANNLGTNGDRLQLNGTTRGIYTTASSMQYIKSITVDFQNANSKNLYFYGSNTAYTQIISSNFGTSLATFTASGTKSVTVGQYKYCYIYSNGAIYMNSITIEWGELTPTLSLSTTSFNFTEGDTGTLSTTATPTNFGGTVTYSFTSSDSSVLSESNVSASTNTISFDKSNCSAGLATITVTATYSSQSASATFTVECAAAQRNLTSIAITTASSDTLFEKDAKFTITDLVVTGTFDAAPLSSDVTADCTFKLWDGSSETALTPGTTTLGTAGDFTVRISHSENIHSPAQILTYSISVFATKNFTLGSEGAAGYDNGVTNDFDVTLNSSTSLTSTVDVYSFNFYSNTGMQMNVSSRGNAYIYNTIAVPGKIVRIELTWKQAYAGSTPTIYFSNSYMDEAPASGGIMGTANVTTESIVPASGNNYYFYFNAQTTTGAIVLTSLKVVYIETAAGQVQNFADKYLHMNDYTSSAGYCMNDSDQHYYSDAKTAYGKLTTEQKSAFADNSAAVARLQAWARANGETFDANAKTFNAARITPLVNIVNGGNTVAIVVAISLIGITAIGGYFFLRKRKEEN